MISSKFKACRNSILPKIKEINFHWERREMWSVEEDELLKIF